MISLNIKRIIKDFPLPTTEKDAAGFDFFCRETVIIQPHKIAIVHLNNVIEIPKNHFILLVLRSGTPVQKCLMLATGPGLLDPFFDGDSDELIAEFYNFSDKPVTVRAGEQLVQGVLVKGEPFKWKEVATMRHKERGGWKPPKNS
jgi:dUTPase